MDLYRISLKGDFIEVGSASEESAIEMLVDHRKTEAKTALAVGISRSESDFLEISYVGKEQFLIQTDLITKPYGFLKGLLSRGRFDGKVLGLERATEILRSFFELPRRDFECKLTKRKG